MEFDVPSINQRPPPSAPHILRAFARTRISTSTGISRCCECSPQPLACCGPLGAPSPWLPTGNSRWVTWRASHLLSTPSPSTPWEATPPLTCWPTAACLGDLVLTCPKRWLLSVSHFHYCVFLPLSCFVSQSNPNYIYSPYFHLRQLTFLQFGRSRERGKGGYLNCTSLYVILWKRKTSGLVVI